MFETIVIPDATLPDILERHAPHKESVASLIFE